MFLDNYNIFQNVGEMQVTGQLGQLDGAGVGSIRGPRNSEDPQVRALLRRRPRLPSLPTCLPGDKKFQRERKHPALRRSVVLHPAITLLFTRHQLGPNEIFGPLRDRENREARARTSLECS